MDQIISYCTLFKDQYFRNVPNGHGFSACLQSTRRTHQSFFGQSEKLDPFLPPILTRAGRLLNGNREPRLFSALLRALFAKFRSRWNCFGKTEKMLE